MDQTQIFVHEDEVRDNEVDIQGIVNNANYFIYMAHARHKHLKQLGVDFSEFHRSGYDFLLVRSEIDFKSSLRDGDQYLVTSKIEPLGRIRIVFAQEVIRKADNKIVATAQNIGTCVATATGRPCFPDSLKKAFGFTN